MDNSTLNNKQAFLSSSLLIKLFTILILSLFAPKVFAQLDLIHYVPPFYAGTKYDADIGNHWVVLTTPSEEAITVTIKRGDGSLVKEVPNVSITTPQRYYFRNEQNNKTYGTIDRPNLGIVNFSGLNKVLSNQGLIFTSKNSAGKGVAFYVNIRHKSNIHGLSLTAKGQAALGTSFRSGHLHSVRGSATQNGWSTWSSYIVDHRSHFISVMATEDNTQVTFSDIKVGNLTSDTGTALPVSDITTDVTIANSVSDFTDDGIFNVILNAGESYVLGANHEFLTPTDVNKFNGTKISSDKPIAVNSGSWCGSASTSNKQDIGVDQIVPETLIGNEYILLEGQGNDGSERPVVVATKDGTNISVNGIVGFINLTPLNAGDSYAIERKYFEPYGTMLINTSENVYMYQTTAASKDKPYPTVGMNFIPPLSSLGFRQVDIPFINELGKGIVAIYSQNGADVYVNGVKLDQSTAKLVSNKEEWVVYTYSTTDVNVSVKSNKAIYVAMSVFDNVVGAAGYFSGFTKSISPIDTTIVFNHDLGYVCSSQEGNLELAINSTPTPDWYEWYHDVMVLDSIKFKNENLLIPVPEEATKYILKAYFRDPNMDILYNGDFAIGRGSFDSNLDFFSVSQLEDPGKATLTANPESVYAGFENFTDLDGVGKMLLAHSSGNGASDVIWKQTINSSTDIPGNLFVIKVYGRLAEEGNDQYLDVYVNNEKVFTNFQLNDSSQWKSIKAFWRAGTAESAEIKIVDANASGNDAVFAIDSISFVPAIEATKEFNPDVVPSYSYTPYDQGLHLCKGVAEAYADISYGDMGWFTFLWEKQNEDLTFSTITDGIMFGGADTYKLIFNNVVDAHAGIYRCTINFRGDYEACGIGAEPTSVLVEVFVDEPASMDPLAGITELCEGTPTDVTATIYGDFSVIKWSVSNNTGLLETIESNSNVFTFNPDIPYYEAGVYTVKCEVVNGCSTDIYEEIAIEILGKAKLESLTIPTNLCEVNEITLVAKLVDNYTPANSTLEYTWSKNSDAPFVPVTLVPTYNLTPHINDVSYKVAVNTHYNFGLTNQFTCEGNSIEENLVGNPIDPEIKIVGLSPVEICEGLPQTYLVALETTSDSYTYDWSVPVAAEVGKIPSDFMTNSFSLDPVLLGMAGDYTVTVSNNCDDKSATSTLTVNPKLLVTGVTALPGPYCSGVDVVFSVNDNGHASSYTAKNLRTNETRNSVTNTFTITADATTEGEWLVTAINSCGNKETSFTIDLVDSFPSPTITSREACVGGNVTFDAKVEPYSGPTLNYVWTDPSGASIGENSSTLELNSVQLINAGDYKCVVGDGGCSTQPAIGVLSVDDVTTVNLTPGSLDICEGLTHHFEVTYVGNPTFAWFFTGADNVKTNLNISISSYDTPLLAMANAGLYSCEITTGCGLKEFKQTLNILNNVTVTKNPVTLEICEGGQTELGISVTGSYESIKWYKDDVLLADASSNVISTGTLETAGTYAYKYIVEGRCGDVEGTFNVVVHDKPIITVSDVNSCEGDILLTMAVDILDYNNPSWLKPDDSLLGNGLSATITGATHVASLGNYTAKISTDFCGDITKIANVNVYKPITVLSNSELNPTPCVGKPLSLSVTGDGDALSYRWYKGVTLLGETNNILDLGAAALTDQAIYRCELVSGNLCANENVVFNVDVREDAEITLQPLAKTPCEDVASVTFTVAGTAEGTLYYKWYNNGVEISSGADFAGATTTDLTVSNLSSYDTHLFHCVISGDFCEDVASNQVSLNVIKNVSITTQPANQNIDENETASFSVVATGGGSITYQWYEDKNDGSGFVSLGNAPASAETSNLILTSVPFSKDGYKYHCVVTNACVPDTSDPATLKVNIDNRIMSTILNAEACELSSFTFTVDYKNTTTACIWEYDDGTGYSDASGIGTIASGGTSSTLTVTTATTAMETDSWKFRARVQRAGGYVDNLSNIATVKVYEQIVFDPIADATLCPTIGGSFNVNITVGTGPYTYEWSRVGSGEVLGSLSSLSLSDSESVSEEYNVKVSNLVCSDVEQKFNITRHPNLVLTDLAHTSPLCIGNDIDLDAILTEGPALAAAYVWTKDGTDLSEPSATYGKLSVTTAESGIYKVVVTDNCISKTSSIPITVLDAISLDAVSLPVQTICEGESVDLQVKGTGDNLSYEWYEITALGVGGTKIGLSLSSDKDYHINGLSTIGLNYYRCVLSSTPNCTNPVQEFTVNVLEDVILDPLGPNTICEGPGTSEFKVTIASGTPLSYQWYDNDVSMGGTETNASLFVDNVLVNNGHNYHCVVTGVCKDAESNKALFTVNKNVAITSQPQEVTIAEDGDATFLVEATGADLTYQWYVDKGGVVSPVLGSTTNMLELTLVKLISNGNEYYCIVSGSCLPDVESNHVKLNVNLTSRITVQPQNKEICEDLPFNFEMKYKSIATGVWKYDDDNNNIFDPIPIAIATSAVTDDGTIKTNVLTVLDSDPVMNSWKFKLIIDGGLEESNVAEVKVYQKVLFDDIVVAPLCIGTGKNIIVNVTAGTEPLSYAWSEGARDLGTNSSLNLDAGAALNGTYSVSITTNALCPTVTKSFDISHHPDLVLTPLTHTSPLCIDADINLNAILTEGPALAATYAWTKDGGSVGSDNPLYGVLGSGTTAGSSIYKVVVTDNCTSKTSSIPITVLDAITLAAVSSTPLAVCEGESFDLQVKGTGDNLSYEWYQITALGVGGTQIGPSIPSDEILHIDGLSTIGANYYRCVLSSTPDCTNPVQEFTVNVSEDIGVGALVPITICEDLGSSNFIVTVTKGIPSSYKWYDNNVLMPGEITASLSVNNELANNGHNYHCVVGGTCKSAESNTVLFTVNENVTITSDPIDQTIDEMGSATFTVAATGTIFSYQWFEKTTAGGAIFVSMGNTPVSAQTNTLNLTSVPLSDTGYSYKCLVTGACDPDESTPATLTLVKENRILVQAEPAVICDQKPFTFEVQYKTVTDDCVWQYSTGGAFIDVPVSMGTGDETIIDANTKRNILTITTAEDAMNSWKFRAVVKRTGFVVNNSNDVNVRVDIPANFADISPVQICNGDGASFNVNTLTGSTPNTYAWTEGARNLGTNSSLSLIATDATDGTYSVGVTAGVCPATVKTFDISHYDDLALNNLIHANELCPTDDINLSVTINPVTLPAPGITYAWTKDDGVVGTNAASYTDLDVTDAESGLYKVTVEDLCMTQSKSINIDVLDIITKVSADWTDKPLCVGDALLFEAGAAGDNPIYVWTVPAGVTPPVNVATFKVDEVTEANEGVYTCVVTGACGYPVTYTASVVVDDGPNITTDLNLSAVCVGKELKLGPIVYDLTTNTTIDESIKWILPDGSISLVTALELDLLTAEVAEEGNYRVEVSNVCGTDFSVGYQDVHPIPTLDPIADQIACQGGNVIFRAETTGENLIYSWLLDNVAVAAALDGKPEFVISNIQPEDANKPQIYTVECIVTSCRTSESETATVTVNPNTILEKSIKGDVKYVGEDYEFELEVTGSNLVYVWHHINTLGNDVIIVHDNTRPKILTLNNLILENAGEYYCIITGDCGVRFTSGYLTVKDPIKLVSGLGTVNIEKCFGEALNLNISVEGEVFSIDWYKGTMDLNHHALNYSIPSLAVSDGGDYRCEIRGEGGSITENVKVTVYETTVLKSHLTDRIICELEGLLWTPDVGGSGLTYEWKRDGNPISTEPVLEILNTPMDSAGIYSVDISGECGNVSSEANLSLNKLPFFISKSDDENVCENYEEIVFTVAYGGDNLEYQWQKDNSDIDGAKSSEFKLQNIGVNDAGEYKCIVSSSCGLDLQSIMKLDVTPKLKILSESLGLEICDGEDALFEIEVEGNDVVYQWKKDGVNINTSDSITGINTSQLTINPADLNREGYYNCAVTDMCTTTERYSNSKNLTVNALPNSQIFGRMTLCVLEDRVAYNTDLTPNINYGWLVDGGDFTTPTNGDRTKITWGDIVEGSMISLEILNEATGCSSKLDSAVTLRPLPTVNLSALETKGICESEFEFQQGFPAGGIYWVDGVAQNRFDPGLGNGEYNVRYSYTDDYGCSNTTGELVMKIDSLPIVKIIEDVVVGTCETIQLSATTEEEYIRWSPGLFLDDRDSKTPTFTAGETTLYVATVVDKHGCVGNDIINVAVAPLPLITTINDTIIGECKEIQLTTIISGDIADINWTNPSDLDDPNNSNPKLINRQVGVNDYQINVTDKYGCVALGNVQVEVLPNPEIGENHNLCEGETLLVDIKDLSNPIWSDGYSAWERIIDKPGEYELIVEQNDCELIQKIVMNPLPKFELDNTIQPGIVIFEGQTVTLEPDLNLDYGPFVYDWSDGSVLPQLEVSESGVYKLKVEDNLGCIATDTVEVFVKPIGIEAPNAFTPLSGNDNDHFYLKDINVTDEFEMYIYNRWGELLYKTDEPGIAGGWDGTYRGESCPVGTYVWVVMLDGKLKEKGTVTLLR